jgi:uncharacterized membrane protein YkoI
MKTTSIIPALALTGFLFLAGCTDRSSPSSITQPETMSSVSVAATDASQDYVGRAIALVPGTATATEHVVDAAGNTLVRVTVTPRNGAAVTVSFDAGTGVLASLSGGALNNSFDVDPGPYFISVSLAAELVQRDVIGSVSAWSFARNAVNNEWAYTLTFDNNGSKRQVVISAISKNVLSNTAL